MVVALNITTGGIHKVARVVQNLDNDATVYTSAGGNTLIIEIPNYSDDTKKYKEEMIIEAIKQATSKNGVLQGYSKVIICERINSDGIEDYFVTNKVYSLPDMKLNTEEGNIYIDFTEYTKKTLSTSEENKDINTELAENNNIDKRETENTNTQNTQAISNSNNTTITPNTIQPSTQESSNITQGQKNALSKAKDYIKISAFSRDGLIKQLEYEKFSNSDAIYGADNCGTNWNEQALRKAKEYLNISGFSKSGLRKQLEYEKFTSAQVTYGVDNCGADWNEQAAKKAKSYISTMTFSRNGLIQQLKYEGFTGEQAEYGANSVGY